MNTEIEKLPRLIERASAALAKATTAAEFLEAQEQADIAYTAAKMAARMSKFKDAHDTVLAACRKAMADALVIESRAQCRLADEYDAAQERGEVQKAGGARNFIVPNKNNDPTVTDIGLTRKQVYAARVVRDAEKAEPGIVRKTVEAKLQANEEPTRADLNRAIKPKPKNAGRESMRGKNMPTLDLAVEIVQGKHKANEPVNPRELQTEHGISHVTFDAAIGGAAWYEKGYKQGLADAEINPASLSMSAQAKLEVAIRQHTRKLESEFNQRVNKGVEEFLDETILPDWRKKIDQAKKIFNMRRGLMNKETFNTIRRALHPDSRQSISDHKLGLAFDEFMELEKYLLSEKDSPTRIGEGMPMTFNEAQKRKTTEARREKRSASRGHLAH